MRVRDWFLAAYRQKQNRRRRTGKRRVFWNSIALLISAPLIGWAAAEGPDGKFPASEVAFGVMIALIAAVFSGIGLWWSLTPDSPGQIGGSG